VASEFSVGLDEHRTRAVDREEVARVDLILGFQGHHAADVARRWPDAAARVRLLGDFLPAPPYRIEDPWGQSEEVFRDVFTRIVQAVEGLEERLGEAPR
jgi:protein-tyrosine-phosphatase